MIFRPFVAALAIILAVNAAPAIAATADSRPYDPQLLRLAEILGAVHYLRELCGANEGQIWRGEMQALVDTEGTSAIRRARLVASFNKGYRSYRRTYQSCTKSAETAVERFIEEGALLTDSIGERTKPAATN